MLQENNLNKFLSDYYTLWDVLNEPEAFCEDENIESIKRIKDALENDYNINEVYLITDDDEFDLFNDEELFNKINNILDEDEREQTDNHKYVELDTWSDDDCDFHIREYKNYKYAYIYSYGIYSYYLPKELINLLYKEIKNYE